MKDWLKKNRGLLIALGITLAIIVYGSYGLANKKELIVGMIPLTILMAWLFVARFETTLLLMALLTPFAINVALFQEMELSLPVEPMMILFTAMFFFRVLVDKTYDKQLLRHPVSRLLLASLAWMSITSATSEMPWVSIKYTLARIWFVVPFFFAAVQIFKSHKRIRQFYWAYAIGLAIIILITTSKTLGNFSDLQTMHRVMKPFYNDHTAYGCVIALMLPVAFYFLFQKVKGDKKDGKAIATNLLQHILHIAFFILLCVGLVLSYCRAAWISVAGVLVVYILIRMRMKIKWMLMLFCLGVGLFFVHQSDILYNLGKNHQDSSYTLADQLKSISNISTDASNLERLNRWASAFRLWEESPVVGCGPGTYQFLYGSRQRSYQLSTISTNAGDLGNAHSEYIGPLTEQGVPGVALVALLFLTTFATGVRVYRTAKDPHVARIALAFTLSLLTYYIHGVFNNFLDTDKLSVPFWAFTAVIVALDVYSEKKECEIDNSNKRYIK